MIDTITVQNLLVPFCCVLRKDNLRQFLCPAVLASSSKLPLAYIFIDSKKTKQKFQPDSNILIFSEAIRKNCLKVALCVMFPIFRSRSKELLESGSMCNVSDAFMPSVGSNKKRNILLPLWSRTYLPYYSKKFSNSKTVIFNLLFCSSSSFLTIEAADSVPSFFCKVLLVKQCSI